MTRITFLGTSDAFHSGARRHSSCLLEHDGIAIVVDFGPTALLSLRTLQIDPARIDAVFITHLHGDHMGGLPFLVLDGMYYSIRRRSLQIFGPVLMKERFEMLTQALYGDVMQQAVPFDVRVEEWRPNQTVGVGPLQIQTFLADHMDPPHEPLMLRITIPGGRVISFSGDTAYGPGLEACADGADLLIAECTGLCPPMGRHTTFEDWQRNISRIRARRVVLTHLGAPLREGPRALLEHLGDARVGFADDGLVVDL